MEFPDSFFIDVEEGLKSALDEMSALESGQVANVDEQRMVGHYWLRNPEIAPTTSIKRPISAELEKIRQFCSSVHNGTIAPESADRFTQVMIVGIGGSALGPQLVSAALWEPEHKMQLHFCDNTDPDGIDVLVKQLGDALAETVVLVISKSGGTVETRNGALEIRSAFEARGLSFARHVVAITQEESKLDAQAKAEGWLERFYIWDWVGGRTSVFSAVGLLPAALQGINIDQFLEGAKEMDRTTRSREVLHNPACLLAAMWWHAGGGKGARDMVTLPYKDRLILFSRYLQQLVMESLGKKYDREGKTVHQGLTVYGNKGSTDQHAYVQQLRDGLNNFFVTFIEVSSDFFKDQPTAASLEVEPETTSGDYLSGFFLGTRQALYEGGRESITITLDSLDPFKLGALIALYDRTVGIYASLIDVNAYHQPGVEAGKKAAGRVIELQRSIYAFLQEQSGMEFGASEIANAIDAEDETETVFKILEHLAANASRGISRSAERQPAKARYRYIPLQ
jgi:glucose-6-phosphate isomerase